MKRPTPLRHHRHLRRWFRGPFWWCLLHATTAPAQMAPAALPDLKLSTAGIVNAIAVQEDGKIVIGGRFISVNNIPRTNIARLNPNGSVDVTWNASLAGQQVHAIVVHGTNVYVGGDLSVQDDAGRHGLVRLSATDGTTDKNWSPKSQNPAFTIHSIAMVTTNVCIGGSFTNVGGLVRSNLACLSTTADGGIITNWNPVANGRVRKLIASGTNLYVLGDFTRVGSQTRSNLARLVAGTGVVDPTWDARAMGGVADLAVSDTNIFASGPFTNLAGVSFPNNFLSHNIARLSATTPVAVDTNWHGNGGGPLALMNDALFLVGVADVGNGPFYMLRKVAAQGTGEASSTWGTLVFPTAPVTLQPTASGLFVGGTFNRCGGAVSLAMARVDAVTGVRDPAFAAHVQNPGIVHAIARQPDGKVILGGDFWFAGGLPRQNLVRMEADGSFDAFWSPDVAGTVRALVLDGTNVFVGGGNVGSGPILRKFATQSSDAPDPNWVGVIFVEGMVHTLAAGGTNLFVGGQLTPFSIPFQLQPNLAKVATGTGKADPDWPTTNMGARIHALALDGTNLYVGGSFNTLSGVNRTNLARVSALTGTVDTNWNAPIGKFATAGLSTNDLVQTLVVNGANLFVGGTFTNIGGLSRKGLAKVSLTTPAVVDPVWNPMVGTVSGVQALSTDAAGAFLFVGGSFMLTGLPSSSNLCKVATTGTGLPDTSFRPNPNGPCTALLATGSNTYVGGAFSQIHGTTRYGFAYLPVAHAPQLIQDSSTNFHIFPNAENGPEVTHFRITAITNGTLMLSDGVTVVSPGQFVSLAEGAKGLRFVPGGTLTAVSSLNDQTNGTGLASATLTMVTNPGPVIKFSSATADVREDEDNIVITIRKFGGGTASVGYTTQDLTATGALDYQTRAGTFNFSATDKLKNLVIAIANDLQTEGDEQFAVTLTNASSNTTLAGPTTATVTIVDNDIPGLADSLTTTVLPPAPPVSTGVLSVTLQPSIANGQWRLLGELNWHDSGATVSGLVTGNYGLEFRPVNGYRQPETVTVPVTAGATNNVNFFYAATTVGEQGNLFMIIEPADVATATDVALRGQWQREGETNWHDDGVIVAGLNAGSYTVKFKPIAGRLTPAPVTVLVGGANANYGSVGTYLASAAPGAETAAVVPFSSATTNEPYVYNGQIQTSVGFGSGFVVKQKVVLTAAHVLFDDVQLAYVTDARWFFQRYRGQLEPVPLVPRGWYVFEGYAAQRELDDSPGISTPASQNLDAAAMYFLEDAARGGYGGYLTSDADANEYLLSANNKFLVGYPLDGVAEADQGKLHATTPANLKFSRLYTSVFATTNLQALPGNSGGPLYVQADLNKYLPAAICLGGSGQTLVRAINGEIVDLINRAEISANGGGNVVGGGVTLLSPGVTAPPFGTGLLTVSLTPSNGMTIPPGWRISGSGETNYFTDPVTTVALISGGDYPLEFKPVPGFVTPSNRLVRIAIGQVASLWVDYVPVPIRLTLDTGTNLVLTGGVGASYRVEYTTNPAPPISWIPHTTVLLTTTTAVIPDTAPAANGNRFYRAVLLK